MQTRSEPQTSSLLERIRALQEGQSELASIARLLDKLGFSGNTQGFVCLQRALLLVREDETLLSAMTTRLYPAVAHACSISPQNAERSMRYALECAWKHGDPQAIVSFSEKAGCLPTRRPCISVFLSTALRILKTQEEL